MEEKMKQVLYKWLEIDLVNIAKKMGLSNKSCDVNLELLMDTIRCLDYESIVVKKPSVNYIITVIGLMWEHVDHTKFDLRKFVIKILSRIGYPTSAIICDKDFDKENGTFSGLDSWIDEVALTINQTKNEIMVANQKYLLTDYQKQIWDSMDNDKVLGISAPTSAGKSFVILLKLVDRLINDNIDIVYIVPTLSLLNQVTEDFNRELKKVGVTDYWISNSFDDQQLSNKKNIYIMTQEKAIAAFSDTEKAFTKRLILVADVILLIVFVSLAVYAMYERKKIATYQLEAIWGKDATNVKQVADRQKAIEDILFCLRVKIYNNSCVIKQNIRFIEARKHTNDSYLISRYEDYTTEIEQIKKLLAEIWNIPYGITIYAKHNRKAFVQLRILELLLSDNIGHIELDECNKPALIKIDLTQSNSELKREFMIKWTHCISQVDGITRYLKYMNKKMMRYQRLITNVTDVKELKEIVENIKD